MEKLEKLVDCMLLTPIVFQTPQELRMWETVPFVESMVLSIAYTAHSKIDYPPPPKEENGQKK